MPTAYVAEGCANDRIGDIPPGTIRLVNFSPRYLGLIDYEQAAETGVSDGAWRAEQESESVAGYVREHLETCGLLYQACAEDAVVAVEVDYYRVPRSGRIVALPDLWREMLELSGFRISERIALVRRLAIGHRSGHFKKYRGRPGYYLPDNVTSDLIIAFKGDPLARLRRDGGPNEQIDAAWAEQYLRNAWTVRPPDSRRKRGHPVPQDAEVARAVVLFYSLIGDLVLDPFSGSGTTARAALREGRSAVAIERVPRFAREIAASIGPNAQPLARLGGRGPLIPGAQLLLPFGDGAVQRVRQAFLMKTTLDDASARLKRMAARASEMSGVDIPPELVALLMRAERAEYRERRSTKRRTRAAA